MEQDMDKITEVENEEDIDKEEDTPTDFKILQRSINLLNDKLEASLANEEEVTKKLTQAEKQVDEMKAKVQETEKICEKKIEKLKTEIAELKKINQKDVVAELKDSIVKKDRKIRNLDTSVTLLKNFLLFVNNKAIKGLRIDNDELKKEIQTMKDKYIQELEDSKVQLLKEVEKFSTTIPSEVIQSKLKSAEENIQKLKAEHEKILVDNESNHRSEIEKLLAGHREKLEKINVYHTEALTSLKSSHESEIQNLTDTHNTRISELETISQNAIEAIKVENSKLAETIESLKASLDSANAKIEEKNKLIGRYESRSELSEKSTSDKDTEILQQKEQIKDLINSLATMKQQANQESEDRVKDLKQQVEEYRQKIISLKQRHEKQLDQIEDRHSEEVQSLKQRISKSSNDESLQIENLANLLKEKDALLLSTKQSYQTLLLAKTESLNGLTAEMAKISQEKSHMESQLKQMHLENKNLVERFKEELHSVLSLKSAYSDEDTLATKEEHNENVRILNDFFNNPYETSLKRIFKLKRIRKEDKSVDSCNLMVKNHDFETGEHEELTEHQEILKVAERHVNDGRVEDMAMPGPRPMNTRARGRGGPNVPPRGRGGPMARGRGGPQGVPPRPNVSAGPPPTAQPSQPGSGGLSIQIMDPNKIIAQTVRQESPVDKLVGGITTPPRKKSFGVPGSPKVVRSDPFKIQNVNINEEVKKIEEDQKFNIEDGKSEEVEEEYEEEEEESEVEEEEAPKSKSAPKTTSALQSRPTPQNRPVPPQPRPIPSRTPDTSTTKTTEPAISKTPQPSRPVPPPMTKSRPPLTANPADPKQADRKRDAPPLKSRNDEKPNLLRPAQTESQKKELDDRSKTPQPNKQSTGILSSSRVSRFSKENQDEPTVTHAVVRDKSIGERLRSALFPGLLTGASASTLAVTKAEIVPKTEDSKTEETKDKKPQAPKINKMKNNNADLLKQMRMKQKEQDSTGRFEGMLSKVLSLLGRKKNENKPYDFSDDDDDDVPPPPVVKRTENKEKDKKGGKGRLANRYASTFDTTQIAIEDDKPVVKLDEFKPPPLDAPLMIPPTTFNPEPVRSSSPVRKPEHHHNEKEQEKVRQDTTKLPHYEDIKSNQEEADDEYVKMNDSEPEIQVNSPQINQDVDEGENDDGAVSNEIYTKAYNQLQKYKTENKALKREMVKNQRKAELSIDYFVQL